MKHGDVGVAFMEHKIGDIGHLPVDQILLSAHRVTLVRGIGRKVIGELNHRQPECGVFPIGGQVVVGMGHCIDYEFAADHVMFSC